MEQVGYGRLARFGDMNLIDDFVELFPSYKHDDVFLLEYEFVIDRLNRAQILKNVYEQIESNINREAQKKAF